MFGTPCDLKGSTGPSTLGRVIGMVVMVGLVVLPPAPAGAVHYKSPEVKELLKKPLEFLATAQDNRLGGKCLIAMTMLKSGQPASHPQVIKAIDACKAAASSEPGDVGEDIYSTGIAIIFLCSVDPSRYASEINTLMESLETRQKGHGGWGYPDRDTGDTSMTQYGVLSHWEAQQAGFDPKIETIEKVANWLIRTQDSDGGWGYQGRDPGNYTPVNQQVTLSMTTAAAGSSLICADMLGLIDLKVEKQDELPEALILVEEKKPEKAKANQVDPKRLRRAIDLGSKRLAADYKIEDIQWVYYYLYALERYMSFRELAENDKAKETKWYNDGFKFLSEQQSDQGTWRGGAGEAVDTAFAVLFLLRSTRQSIEHSRGFGDGTLVGGRGLPRSLVDVKLRRGRVVDGALAGKVKDLVQILSDPEHPDYDYLLENPTDLLTGRQAQLADDQRNRLAGIVRSGTPDARRVAVIALAQSDGLDGVPALIFALTDPDPQVYRAARDGLRRISRKFNGFAMADTPSDGAQSNGARSEGIEKWKAWYRTIRPDAIFIQ